MTTSTIVHNVVSITRKVTHFPKFISTRFTFVDGAGNTFVFDAFSEQPIATTIIADEIVPSELKKVEQ